MILCCVIVLLCLAALLYMAAQQRLTAEMIRVASEKTEESLPVTTPAIPEATQENDTIESSPMPEKADVPIDFAYLQNVNSHICAWLTMPFTQQEYPVLIHPTDDEFYIDHGLRGEYSANGSLFVQSLFNDGDFSDPCTVIYGHNMASGAMFGSLKRSIPKLMLNDEKDENNYLTVYTPTGIRTYRIQCAGEYSDAGILFEWDFSLLQDAEGFFRLLRESSADGYWQNESFSPEEGGQYIILSTCLRPNSNLRFLVVAELIEQQGY